MEATGSNPVEPTNMDKRIETERQLPFPKTKPSGSEHPFVKGKTLRVREPILMKVFDGNSEREVQIFPAEDPTDDFIAIDTTSGDTVELTEEKDKEFAKKELLRNPFQVSRRK